ncbi:MAG: thiamine phosphate synthase [Clostridia bacterium]
MFSCDFLSGHILAVSSRVLCRRPFPEQIERVCRLHPLGLILREKDLPENAYQALAADVIEICARYGVPCILHSFITAARNLNVRKIHLPLWKLEEAGGKAALASFDRIGVSVHSAEEAVRAQELGAAYVTAGHVYATACKKDLPPRGTAFLRDVCSAVRIPVYAIGGIRLEENQIREVLDCGAAGACIMSEMMYL